MKRIVERQQTPLRFMAIAVIHPSVGPRQLQRAFPCFGSAVTKKRAVEAGDFREPLGQLRLILVIEEIRRVNQLACLLL